MIVSLARPDDGGTLAEIVCASMTVTSEESAAPKATTAPAAKPFPAIVTIGPPSVDEPDVDDSLLTLGDPLIRRSDRIVVVNDRAITVAFPG